MLTKNDFDQLRVIISEQIRAETPIIVRQIVQDEIAPLKTDVATLKTDVGVVKQDILVISHKISGLEHRITGLELSTFRLEKRMISVQDDFVLMINSFGEEYGKMDNRLVTIEDAVGIHAG